MYEALTLLDFFEPKGLNRIDMYFVWFEQIWLEMMKFAVDFVNGNLHEFRMNRKEKTEIE